MCLPGGYGHPLGKSRQELNGQARLEIVDVQGRVVNVLFDAIRPAGEGSAVWNGLGDRGEALPSGVYFYRLEMDGFLETKTVWVTMD